MKSLLHFILLCGILSQQRLATAQVAVGDTVCVEGFVMDTFCIELETLLDNPSIRTLEGPGNHSLHCLIDIDSCREGSYNILKAPGKTGLYSVAYLVDEAGKKMLIDIGRGVGKCGTCKPTGTLQRGFRAEVTGTVTDLGNGADLYPKMTVTSAKASNGRTDFCTNATAPVKSPVKSPVTAPASACANLIANSDMELGYEGFWEKTSRFASLSTTTGYNTSPTAIRYVGSMFGLSGPSYITMENMDVSCLTPGSTWELTAQIRLTSTLFGSGARCVVSRTCPQVKIDIQDSSGNVVVAIASRDYVVDSWSREGFNELRTTFTLPSSGWDGTVGDVSIEVARGLLGANAIILDDFFIRSMQ